MDLIASESRKTGTRGGRADFSWDTVNKNERQYYLGNSIAGRDNTRASATRPDFDWYAKPFTTPAVPHAPTVAPASNDSCVTVRSAADDLQAVRRKEKAIMEKMIVGRSFSDAVRSALTESVGNGVDDEGTKSDAVAAAARKDVLRRKEKSEKAQRKEMRKRARELRRLRRAERYTRRDRQNESQDQQHESSESERGNIRNRIDYDVSRRRRRPGRETAPSRKRPEWTIASDSDDSIVHRARRQRVR